MGYRLLFKVTSDNCLEAYILADEYTEAIKKYQTRYPEAIHVETEWLVNFISWIEYGYNIGTRDV